MKSEFGFEEITTVIVEKTLYCNYSFEIFKEISTDVLWIGHGKAFCEMHDPETGLPLTYKVWQEKYQKK